MTTPGPLSASQSVSQEANKCAIIDGGDLFLSLLLSTCLCRSKGGSTGVRSQRAARVPADDGKVLHSPFSLSLSRNQNRAVEQVRRLEQPALHEESIGTKGYTGGCRRQESLSHPPEAVCPIHPRDTLSPLLTPVPLLSLRSATRVDCRSGHSLLTIQSNCQLKGRREKEEERVSFDDSCDLFQRKKCDVRCAKRARVEQPSSQEGGKRRVSGSS